MQSQAPRRLAAFRLAMAISLTETWHGARKPASTTVNRCGRTFLSSLASANGTVATKRSGYAALGPGRADDGDRRAERTIISAVRDDEGLRLRCRIRSPLAASYLPRLAANSVYATMRWSRPSRHAAAPVKMTVPRSICFLALAKGVIVSFVGLLEGVSGRVSKIC